MEQKQVFKNIFITLLLLCLSFGVSLLLQNVFTVDEHITTVFVFAVFLISMLTEGYFYGILAAFAGTLAVNYAFTFPFFALNFSIPVNFVSALIMVVISLLTSALTTQIKRQESIKAEGERERMRADLLRAISHDLRTPLTTIYGSSATLLENHLTLSEDRQLKMLEGIKEDALWLTHMVENLLSITRIDSGRVEIIKTPTVLDELVDSVLVKFKKLCPEQPVTLDLPEEMVSVPMDALLIEQVLINFLQNAVQHAKEMTTLTLRISLREGKAVFEVIDDGCGIAPQRLQTVFSGCRDTSVSAADSQKHNMGIGLSLCHAIVKAHGGEISAENLSSGGALFRFTLATEAAHDE